MSRRVAPRIALAILSSTSFWESRAAHAQDVPQCIASNEKSIELRKAGKLRDALGELRTCAAESCLADIRSVCQQRAVEVRAALPSIVFSARDPSGRDLSAVRVNVDGQQLADKLDGTAMVVDPGEHVFILQAEGQAAVEMRLIIREGEKNRSETVVIGAPAVERQEDSGKSRRTIGWVVGGAGAAAVIVGGVTGLVAGSKWSSSKNECGAPGCDPISHAAAVSDHDNAVSLATVSTIAFIAGGAALAAGAVLFFTAPSGRRETPAGFNLGVAPAVGPGSAAVLVKAAF